MAHGENDLKEKRKRRISVLTQAAEADLYPRHKQSEGVVETHTKSAIITCRSNRDPALMWKGNSPLNTTN